MDFAAKGNVKSINVHPSTELLFLSLLTKYLEYTLHKYDTLFFCCLEGLVLLPLAVNLEYYFFYFGWIQPAVPGHSGLQVSCEEF